MEEVRAIYVKENASPFDVNQRNTVASIYVPIENLRGHSEAEIIKMAKKATPKGYEFKKIEGLKKVKGLLKKV